MRRHCARSFETPTDDVGECEVSSATIFTQPADADGIAVRSAVAQYSLDS